MIRARALFIVICGFAVNLWATNSTIVLQEKGPIAKLFITGEGAETLFDLLVKGVSPTNLPNGIFLEGGNIACAKTLNKENEFQSFCAFNLSSEGLIGEETPIYTPSVAATQSNTEIKEFKNIGQVELNISGAVSNKIFNLLKAQENKQGIKIGKNIFCKKQEDKTFCTTLINQRGFADFPEILLFGPSSLSTPYRGDK